MKKILLAIFLVCAPIIHAQSTAATGDTRTVTEPTIPTGCTVVRATKYLSQTTSVSLDPYNRTAGSTGGTFGVLGATGATSYEPSSTAITYTADESPDDTAWNAALAAASTCVRLSLGTSGQQAIVLAHWVLSKKVVLDIGTEIDMSRDRTTFGGSNCSLVTTGSSSCSPHYITAPSKTNVGIYGFGTINLRGWDRFLPPSNTSQSIYTNRTQSYANKHGGTINGYPTASPNGAGNNSYGPNAIDIVGGSNIELYGITIKDSGNFFINLKNSHDVTIWGVTLVAPHYMSNTDGIDTVDSQRVTIRYTYISNGDNHFAFKSVSSAGSQDITAQDIQTGGGIAAAIGTDINTGGIRNVLFDRFTQRGNLANVESAGAQGGSSSANGGVADKITWQKFCMQNEGNSFRIYSNYGGQSGSRPPTWTNMLARHMYALASPAGKSGHWTFQGIDNSHRIQLQLDDVGMAGTNEGILQQSGVTKDQYADVRIGPGPVASSIISQLNAGILNTVTGTASGSYYSCTSSMWKQLVGWAVVDTPTGSNLKSYSNATSPTTYTVKATVRPTTATNNKEQAELSKPITVLDNGVSVATVNLSGDNNYVAYTVSSPPSGLHLYSFMYPGDANYTPFVFGSVAVDNGGPVIGPPPPPTTYKGTKPLIMLSQ